MDENIEKDDEIDTTVDFLYRAMLERDPSKRRVKPVEPHLLQLEFADGSSDDSDFKVVTDDDSDDDLSDVDNEDDSEQTDDDDDDDDDESADDDTGRHGSCYADVAADKSSSSKTLSSLPPRHSSHKAHIHNLKLSVCCICLEDASEQDNEIVECDGCGASVHEGCYGVSEMESVDNGSSSSSASTEPWFCDACRAGIKPRCELCPNEGGIYKETDAKRWVHLVCALYVPGVAFSNVDKLNGVTLFEMPYTKWGAKECSLCEDELLRRTGVCISCDAGMCRSYFHVTCAQREGLLTESAPDEDIADPFFAYCKQHADKHSSRLKRRNWLAVQSNMKNFEQRLTDRDKLRVQRKLMAHQQRYADTRLKPASAWVPTVKMPRMLVTSAYALRLLLKKTELIGLSSVQTAERVGDICKKWHVAPTLSVDFVGYYLDRNTRIDNLQKHVHDLITQRETLQFEETRLHQQYGQLTKELSALQSRHTQQMRIAEALWNTVTKLAPKVRHRGPGMFRSQRLSKSPPEKRPAVPSTGLLHRCDTCKKTRNQHLLVKCDNCCQYHHLSCLDPPLLRMPKKTKSQGWQCSECVKAADVSDNDTSDASQPRRLRHKTLIREPVKYATTYLQPQRMARRGRSYQRARQAVRLAACQKKLTERKVTKKYKKDRL